MELNLSTNNFLVLGATSGFGYSITKQLVNEGAHVLAVSRTLDNLNKLKSEFQGEITIIQVDLTKEGAAEEFLKATENINLQGIVVNAGGPPAMSALESKMADWDYAYQQVLRWKIELTKIFLPKFMKQNFGRFVFIESASVKQPIPNLVLSNSLRMAVVGYVKTLSQELAKSGITFNILAPGYHLTSAVDRIIRKNAENQNITFEDAKNQLESNLAMGKAGNPDDFASLVVWLLSPLSDYVNGQVFYIDGGNIKASL